MLHDGWNELSVESNKPIAGFYTLLRVFAAIFLRIGNNFRQPRRVAATY
jgi:hypothetical protein